MQCRRKGIPPWLIPPIIFRKNLCNYTWTKIALSLSRHLLLHVISYETNSPYGITGKFGELYLANEPFERNWQILIGVATTALTLRPPENFNLAINGQIRQIVKLKKYCQIFPLHGIKKEIAYILESLRI